MKRVVLLVLPAMVIVLAVVVLGRGFLVSDPNWRERIALTAALAGLALALAASMLRVRRGIALAGLAICLAAVGYIEWIAPGGGGANL